MVTDMLSMQIPTPLGEMLAVEEDGTLIRLDFPQTRYPPKMTGVPGKSAILLDTKKWLEIYFSGSIPDFTPPLRPEGTAFRQRVWQLLREIPYGESMTYGELAGRLAPEHGKMSAQAVGQAVGANPISLIIPCHRVLGAGGAITGYGGGLDRKRALLQLESIPYKDIIRK